MVGPDLKLDCGEPLVVPPNSRPPVAGSCDGTGKVECDWIYDCIRAPNKAVKPSKCCTYSEEWTPRVLHQNNSWERDDQLCVLDNRDICIW